MGTQSTWGLISRVSSRTYRYPVCKTLTKMGGADRKTLKLLERDPMAELGAYRDQRFGGNRVTQDSALLHTATLYVGNLSFYTTEEQVLDLFGRVGDVKRVVMGLDKVNRTPCGFCFVEYYNRPDCEAAMRYVNGTRLDDRIIRTDYDAGFKEGRQYGRGRSGGQVRDEYRTDFDPGRGGFGKRVSESGIQAVRQDRPRRGRGGGGNFGGNKRKFFESRNQARAEVEEEQGGHSEAKQM